MSPRNFEYYRARAAKEREQALAADRKNVAAIHLELASLYDALANEPAMRPKLSIVTPKRLSA